MASFSSGQRRRPLPMEIGVQRTVERTVAESPYPPGWRGEVVTTCFSDHDPRHIARERERERGPEPSQAQAAEERPAMPTLSRDMPDTPSGSRKRLSASIGSFLGNLPLSPRKLDHRAATGMDPLPAPAMRRSEPSQQQASRLLDERSARGIVEDRAEFKRTGKDPHFGTFGPCILVVWARSNRSRQCRRPGCHHDGRPA